ncbi:MAG: serpin family protein [Acidobacteria bacterium]|nr:serpin family protein [Acidobacteriota bacterium]
MNIGKIFVLAAIVCATALLIVVGCADADSSNNFKPMTPTETPSTTEHKSAGETTMSPTVESLVAANNEFGFALFSQLRNQDKDKNLFISPLSIATALSMTYNGAAGETELAMKRTLKYGEMNQSEINQSSSALMAKLKSADPKIELLIANSLWARHGVQFNPTFLERNRQVFGAEIAALDFGNPQTVNTINNWVSQNTKGKIPKIIEQIGGDKVLFLINAVYFKGQWQKKFDAAKTEQMPFHLAGGGTKQTPMMSQSGSYQYLRGDNFQAVGLPYGQGGANLYLFLPDEGSTLNGLLNGVNFQKWQQWITSFRNTPGDVKIPRFKMDYSSDLNNPLSAMGMAVAFQRGKADFSGMRQQKDLFISEVKHKAVIEVNEEGTEASAATSVGVSLTSMRPVQQRFTFIADRPFLLAIRDQQTGAILFLGVVFEPM